MPTGDIVVVVAANIEWSALLSELTPFEIFQYPLGEYFFETYQIRDEAISVRIVKIGWGKISSAAATQYVIDHWMPGCILNIGTCGGIEGRAKIGDVVQVSNTIVYDLHVEIGDPASEIAFYSVELQNNLLDGNLMTPVIHAKMLSADRDLKSSDVKHLVETYDAVVADWESGAIAFVTDRNRVPCVILRYVTDLIGENGGESYDGMQHVYTERTGEAMRFLCKSLNGWLGQIVGNLSTELH